MILELDTSLLDKLDINLNQLVFISLVENENQKTNQDIRVLLSRVNEEDIQDLINRNIIVRTVAPNGTSGYLLEESINQSLKTEKDRLFDVFYDTFPVYVMRPDGTKGFLRANVNKCRKEYNRIVGKSKAMHEHIMDCLHKELEDKMLTGKLGYMKTMWKWLVNHEWECYEDQLAIEQADKEVLYGTAVS